MSESDIIARICELWYFLLQLEEELEDIDVKKMVFADLWEDLLFFIDLRDNL